MGIGTGTAALIGGVASAGAGIAGSAMQASAAQTAAQQQAQAAQKGINIAQGNLGSAVQAQQAATGQIQPAYTPYMQAGAQGVGTLSGLLGTPGQGLLQGWNQQFQAPTAAQAAATPGYQFALGQGLNAIQASAAARGNLLTGGTAKALNNYAQGMASTTYQQTYNNAFQNYLQNYGQFQQNQLNQYNRLMGLTGIGTGAVGDYGRLTQAGAGNLADIYNKNTAAMSDLLGTQGTAQASGTMGAANAWAGGLTGAASGLSQGLQGYANAQPQIQTPWADLGSPTYTGMTPNITAPSGTLGVTGVAPGMGGNAFGGIASGSLPNVYGGFNATGNLSAMNPYGTTFGMPT